ncbi:uncharacterized protein LOC130903984 isoform X1 [Diorhabda carinulata]|uniref:uncharacterized protein LOC130903984 isoform X1 n=1 Tax=Diorhabda carinulata TaxID=1163345 RepID=UPI0025A24571|nr:uncharacterized protein LOC130903984 isoform X1 [Diorhabda carinulata]
MKNCHRSTLLPVIFWGNANKVEDCMAHARQKKGMAFNFSPLDGRKYSKRFTPPCQVLGCPEIAKSSTLIEDVAFDYYSVYGNWSITENSTCIKSIGLFTLLHQKQNYTKSIDACQKLGADIADVTSDIRTRRLSEIIDNLNGWYNVAYVGLDDMYEEGNFVTSFDVPLKCVPFRSWAPGHPISDTNKHNCVVLDANQLWRVVDCRRKFPVLCELLPQKPKEDGCDKIPNKDERIRCVTKFKNNSDFVRNLTRIEQCAIWNAEDNFNKNKKNKIISELNGYLE